MSLQLERRVAGYWCPMLATTGLRLYDRSGRGNHGTLTNMDAASDWVTSKVRNTAGRVLDFDGVSGKVVGATNRSFQVLAGSVWVNPRSVVNSASTAQGVIQWTFGAANVSTLEFGATTGLLTGEYITLIGAIGNSSYRRGVTDGGSLAAGQWHYIAWRWNGSDYDFFVNGSIRTSSTNGTPAIQAGTGFLLGCESGFSAGVDVRFFNGQIAEACIWNRAITPSEIRSLYRIGPGWFGKRESRFPGIAEQAAGFKACWARRQSQLIGGGL